MFIICDQISHFSNSLMWQFSLVVYLLWTSSKYDDYVKQLINMGLFGNVQFIYFLHNLTCLSMMSIRVVSQESS